MTLALHVAAERAKAVDGFMIRVTASPGEIKSGKQTLATAPAGTRLWCFEFKDDGWAEVKVPGKNQHGWLYKTQFEVIEETEAEKARLQEAYARYDRYLELEEQQKLPEARRELDACLGVERSIKGDDHPDVADTLNNLGNLASVQGDYPAARKYYDEALNVYRKVLGDEHADTAMTLNNLGLLVSAQGDYSAARKYYEEALSVYRKVLGDEHADTAMTVNNLGILAHDQGDYLAARSYYEQALAVYRKVLGDEHPSTATTLNNLGNLASVQGDYPLARNYYEQALAVYRKVLGDEHTDTAMTLNNLGLLAGDQGDYSAARKYYDEALDVYRKILGDEHPDTAMTLNNLGLLASDQEDYPAARTYFDQALAVRRNVLGDEHPDTADTLNNLGALASDQEDYPAARKYYEQALNVYRKIFGDEHPYTAMTLNNLGLLAGDQGDYPAARKYCEEALNVYRKVFGDEHPDTAITLHALAWLGECEGQPQLASGDLDQARRIVRRHQARVLPALSEREQLLFLAANDKMQLDRSLSFGRSQRSDPRIAAMSAAWLVNGKAVAQEALAEGALLSTSDAAPLVERLRAVRGRLATLAGESPSAEVRQEIAQLETEQQELIRQIAAVGTGFSAEEPWVAIGQLRGELSPKSALVNIARFQLYDFHEQDAAKRAGPVQYVAWIIPAIDEGAVEIIDLGEAAAVDAAVQEVRLAMNGADAAVARNGEEEATKEVAVKLAALSELIWKPLAGALAEKKELVLSPDGALWLAPWAALPIADDKSLLERYGVRYVTSGRELVARRTARTGVGAPVVMADPDFDLTPAADAPTEANLLARRSAALRGNVERLPGTAREAEAIGPALAKFGAAAPVVYLNRQASEEQFKDLYRPRVLVCSTHGFFLEDQEIEANQSESSRAGGLSAGAGRTREGRPLENPLLRCGLMLAGANQRDHASDGNDGVLTGLEIIGVDLRGTEMVVLSACDTGVGEVRNGEGVAGLRQAFELAGAKSVIATLWQIPDDETAQLMTDYFVYLSQGQSKTDALRYAQLNRIQEHREKNGAAHPFYWAAFTLTGAE